MRTGGISPLVAKIGGSLWRSPLLERWIAALAAYPGPITLVPGGGPFADTVRAAQGPLRFSDRAAHEMALLAMEQYGLALCDRFDGLALAATLEEAAAIRARGATPVWRPRAMALAAGLPSSWELTSDSLAAWLARESGAARLLLIKSVDLGDDRDVEKLVDPLFRDYARGLSVFLLGPKDVETAQAQLAQRSIPGRGMGFSARAAEPLSHPC